MKSTHGFLGKEETISHDVVQTQIGYLQGKVLTVAEAALEGQKLEAVKSLIKKMFNEQQTWITSLYYPETQMMTTHEAEAKIDNFEEVINSAEEVKKD